MKLNRYVIGGIAGIFATLIIIGMFRTDNSLEFLEENHQFVRNYIHDFSQEWDVKNITDLSTGKLLSNIDTPDGHVAINKFRSYGSLVEIKDLKLLRYTSNDSGVVLGEFVVNARFEHINALVTVIVKKFNGMQKVDGFYISRLSEMKLPVERKT